jgi:microcystin-dependent protein
MSDYYLSELRLVAFSTPPKYWVAANGQTLAINQFQAIFSLIGTTYGGDGRTNFQLPNLQGCAAMSFGTNQGANYSLGEQAGEYSHLLTVQEMPTHNHTAQAVNGPQNSNHPTGNLLANTSGNLTIYGGNANFVSMFPSDISNAGGNQPHSNQSPYLVMNWIIAMAGIFPSRN